MKISPLPLNNMQDYEIFINELTKVVVFKDHSSIENLKLYQNGRKRTRKKIHKKKREKFRNFCDSINPSKSVSEDFKFFNGLRNSLDRANTFSESNVTDKEAINNSFDKLASKTRQENRRLDHFLISRQPHSSRYADIFENDFLVEEYISSVNSFRTHTAPDVDLIGFNLIQRLPLKIHQKMLGFLIIF
ncbi:hypothetical protein KPH14_012578 [Odynerus spinipes]|uniref:Uncharacterized protein n=1 Tax=Odynerus spinipes TaxID=1348599 RepID=A0AAD9RF33_9HYME|nr:hypothetical protein KPH14_012578 [Odynerus spinipes]